MRPATIRSARTLAVGLVTAVMLAGCSHSVNLIPLDGGPHGIGDMAFRGGGMKVYLDGKKYAGPFVPATDPAIVALSAPAGSEPGPVATGRYWGSRERNGTTAALLAAEDGSSIACRFSYAAPTFVGSGLCRGDDGRNYSLRMR